MNNYSLFQDWRLCLVMSMCTLIATIFTGTILGFFLFGCWYYLALTFFEGDINNV